MSKSNESMLGRLIKTVADFSQEKLGILCDLAEKLSGESWREWLAELKKFLRKEQCWVRRSVCWQTWKTVKLGTHRDVNALRTDLKKAGRRIGDWASDILGRITLGDTEHDIELILVSVRELGFKNGATRKDIFDREVEKGLDLCPTEVGPQLALQYLDQPLGEWIIVAMEPIAASVGGLSLFRVGCGGDGLWLYTRFGDSAFFWHPGFRFVFVRRK